MQAEATEFPYINIYLSMCQGITGSDSEDSFQHKDQKVPQNHYMSNHSSSMLTSYDNGMTGEDFGIFAPTPETYCVPSTHDQVCVPDSPKSFTDLDSTQFYPEQNVHIKQEKQEPLNYLPCEQLKAQHPSTHAPPQQLHQQNSMMMKDDESLSQLLMGVMMQDIEHICGILRISPNPRVWSQDDVRKWLRWQAEEYCPESIDFDLFKMNGQEFCNLTQEDFKLKTPLAWSNMYAQLEIWKSACTLDTPCLTQTTDLNQPFYPDFERIPIPAMSPTPSDDSDSLSQHGDSTFYKCSSPCLPAETEQKQTIHLWQFLKELLVHPENYSNCIKWVSQKEGIFKIEDSARVAKLWGKRKNRPAMNYDKLSRSIRQYYKKGIIKKTTHSKRLVYQFCQPYL